MSMYIQNRNGDKNWYLNYRRHRLDGPAVERVNGSKEWWVNGICVSKSELVTLVVHWDLKVLLLSRVINPFCEINVTDFICERIP